MGAFTRSRCEQLHMSCAAAEQDDTSRECGEKGRAVSAGKKKRTAFRAVRLPPFRVLSPEEAGINAFPNFRLELPAVPATEGRLNLFYEIRTIIHQKVAFNQLNLRKSRSIFVSS